MANTTSGVDEELEKQTDAGGRTQPCRRVGESLEHEDPKLEAHESRVLGREGDVGKDQVLVVFCVFPGIHILWDSLTFEKVIRSGGEVTQGWKIVLRRANQFRSFGKREISVLRSTDPIASDHSLDCARLERPIKMPLDGRVEDC